MLLLVVEVVMCFKAGFAFTYAEVTDVCPKAGHAFTNADVTPKVDIIGLQ